MKKFLVSILVSLGVIAGALAVVPRGAVFAAECGDGQVETAIIGGGGCQDATENGIWNIIKTVLDILTIGIGILGVIGITIVGIQYLTAGGSEEKTRKAKRRMFEIVLGLVAYVAIYALLSWLLPGFDESMNKVSSIIANLSR